MKRILSALIALLMTASLLVGCGDKPEVTAPPQATTTAPSSTTETTAPVETSAPTRLDELGEKDWGGRTFTILDANDHTAMHINIPGEELNGDIVNDALFERGQRLEERYGVKFVYQQTSVAAGVSALQKGVLANDGAFDLCISLLAGGALAPLSIDGTLMNLTDVPHLSLDQNWWSPLIYDNLQLGGKMYFTTGDISPAAYQMPACTFVNLDLMKELGIETDLVTLVREGKWTLDALATLTKDLTRDVNNDGDMHCNDDFFGFIHPDIGDLISTMLINGAGVKLSTLSEDKSSISVDLDNENTVNVIEKFRSLIIPKLNYEQMHDLITKTFAGDRALVLMHATESASVHLRDMESEYLILPMPKYDEAQESYMSNVSTWVHAYVAIPSDADAEFSGFVTEALAYDSHVNIRPLAYDLTYTVKMIDNEESAEMLNILFDTMYLDFNCVYNFGEVQSLLTTALKGEGAITTLMSRIERLTQKQIEAFTKKWVEG